MDFLVLTGIPSRLVLQYNFTNMVIALIKEVDKSQLSTQWNAYDATECHTVYSVFQKHRHPNLLTVSQYTVGLAYW